MSGLRLDARALSPMRAPIEVRCTGATARTEISLDPREPVFAGHYPHFPVLPGAFLVDCVLRSAERTAPGPRPLVLQSLDAVRLLRLVRPGDRLAVELTWSGPDAALSCRAVVRTGVGDVATVRLTLRAGGAPW